MLRFDHYFQMNMGDVIEYTLGKTMEIPRDHDSMEAAVPPSRGNLNYVYRVWDGKGHSIYIKQAGSKVRVSKDIKPFRDGNRPESEILMLEDQYASGMVPYVYFFDTVMYACDMEGYSDYAVMCDAMLKHEIFPGFAEDVSTFMVNTLFLSSDVVMGHKEKKELVKKFISPDLCDITEKLMLMEPYMDLHNRNNIYAPNRDFMEKELYEDEVLHLEVNRLEFHFMTDAQALLHGDLHTGSIFIRQNSTKISDCEFGIYASVGYDVGNVVVDLILAYDNGLSTDDGPFRDWCLKVVEETVDLFIEKLGRKYDEAVTESIAKVKGFKEWYLDGILKGTAGYVGTELHRRTAGMANVVDVTTIQDEKKRLLAEHINILAGKEYIMNQGAFRTSADYAAMMSRAKEVAQKTSQARSGYKKGLYRFSREGSIKTMTVEEFFDQIIAVRMREDRSSLGIIDQTLLPGIIKRIHPNTKEEIWETIKKLRARSASAIGAAAAYGITLLVSGTAGDQYDALYSRFRELKDYLASSRPTVINLFWALSRMEAAAIANKEGGVAAIKELFPGEADRIREENTQISRDIGEIGFGLLKELKKKGKEIGVLIHCNAGTLATAKYGITTAPMYTALERGWAGIDMHVYYDETRPLLQGARLTPFELYNAGITITLQYDNMAPILMKPGKIDTIFVGCDRVARNDDAANKIGTNGVVTLAKHYEIPFYVCAPTSTIDMDILTGDQIPTEMRNPDEVTEMWYKERMVPEGTNVYNPASDMTDHSLITGIITEKGVCRAPYDKAFEALGIGR